MMNCRVFAKEFAVSLLGRNLSALNAPLAVIRVEDADAPVIRKNANLAMRP